MSYRVTINGVAYQLPPRTLAVDDKIEHIQSIGKRYAAGEINRRECVAEQYEFVQSLIMPGTIGKDVEEVDTNDLLKWCLDILNAYNEPVRKVQADAAMAEVDALMNRPGMDRVIKAANAAHMARGINNLK